MCIRDRSNGISIGGTGIGMSAGNIHCIDNVNIGLGTNFDCSIVHNGTNTVFENTEGQLRLRSTVNSAGSIYIDADGGTAATIDIRNTQGNTDASILIRSDAGGIKLLTDNGVDIVTDDTMLAQGNGFTDSAGGSAQVAQTATISKINDIIVTTIFVDIEGLVAADQADRIIGETDNGATGGTGLAAAYFTRLDTAKNGWVYRAEVLCTETTATSKGVC